MYVLEFLKTSHLDVFFHLHKNFFNNTEFDKILTIVPGSDPGAAKHVFIRHNFKSL